MKSDYQEPTSSLKSEEGYMYHATNLYRANDIASGGLKAHPPNLGTDQREWPDGSKEKRSYFSKNLSTVWQFAPEEGPHVVLRVHHTSHPFKRESTGDIYSNKKIHPKHIEILHKNGSWHPISNLISKEESININTKFIDMING
jgi:hypothetical protein